MLYLKILILLIIIIWIIYSEFKSKEKIIFSFPGYKPRSLFDYFKSEFDLNYYEQKEKLYGSISNISISVEKIKNEITNKIKVIEVTAYLNFNIYGNITITKEKFITQDDFITGDKLFDKYCFIHSNDTLFTYALLNYKIRKLICNILKNNIEIKINENRVSLFIPSNYKITTQLKTNITQFTSIVNDLNKHPNFKNRIIDNIEKDPDESVVTHNLNYFLKTFSLNKVRNQKLLNHLLLNKNQDIQIKAAQHLKNKKKGILHLINIYNSLTKKDPALKISCIKAFANLPAPRSNEFLKEIYKSSNDKEIKIAILETFYNLHDKSLNDFLVKNLGKEKKDICLIIIKTLQSCGSKEAIEPLCNIKTKLNNHPIIQETIQLIQKNLDLTEEHKGLVSLAAPNTEEGGLSKPDDSHEGALSKN